MVSQNIAWKAPSPIKCSICDCQRLSWNVGLLTVCEDDSITIVLKVLEKVYLFKYSLHFVRKAENEHRVPCVKVVFVWSGAHSEEVWEWCHHPALCYLCDGVPQCMCVSLRREWCDVWQAGRRAGLLSLTGHLSTLQHIVLTGLHCCQLHSIFK